MGSVARDCVGDPMPLDFTDAELGGLEKYHRHNAERGQAYSFGSRKELNEFYVARETKLANMIRELLEFRKEMDK